MKNLPVQSLDFDKIKGAFKAFLRGDPYYKDYNFDASGISSLLNILSYNTHYIGWFVKMLLDESFVDSAHTREALLSIAKRNSYVAKGKRSARADVQMDVTIAAVDDPLSNTILIPRGTSFSSANNVQDKRLFQIIDDVIIYNRVIDGTNIIYKSDPITIYEGAFETYRFVADGDVPTQKFIIKDYSIDIDTIRVNVYPHEGSLDKTEYKYVDDIFKVDGDSNVFYVATNEDGYFQIFFGNDVFGKQPETGNIIEVVYVSTSGVEGNGAKNFTFNAPPPDPFGDNNIGNFEDFAVTTVSESSGGMVEESIESLRFTIPHTWRMQNRIVTEEDYKAIIMSSFRNINSINVWGGEKNAQRYYGKVFVSVKPLYSDAITSSAKNEISKQIIKKLGVVGSDVVFVDPEFIDIYLSVYATIDKTKTNKGSGEIEKLLLDRSAEYNVAYLSKFDKMFSDVNYLDFLKEGEGEIVTVFTEKTLRKKYTLLYGATTQYVVQFSNPIVKGVTSSEFVYGGKTCIFRDNLEDDNLYIYDVAKNTKLLIQPQGSVDYETGDIKFKFPQSAKLVGFEGDTKGNIVFTVTPKYPDVELNLNNIVRIAGTKVILS